MDYTRLNKEAWEEAFEHRTHGWGDDIGYRLETEDLPFIEEMLAKELRNYEFRGKTVAHFCCNNGRELLSIMKLGAERGVGFDIAENMVAFANTTAEKLGINCTFVATNILAIDKKYEGSFDCILVTIGALTWFRDLASFFHKASGCLRQDGRLIIHEMHPVTNMLAASDEEDYDPAVPDRCTYSYFRKEPWIETHGMGYISGRPYESKPFYSYSHTFSDIINSMVQNGICVEKLIESDRDIADMFANIDGRGIPLSYVLIGRRGGCGHGEG